MEEEREKMGEETRQQVAALRSQVAKLEEDVQLAEEERGRADDQADVLEGDLEEAKRLLAEVRGATMDSRLVFGR